MPQHPARRCALRSSGAALAMAGALSLAACASNSDRPLPAVQTPAVSSLTAGQIVTEAQRSLSQAASVHITGQYRQDGKPVQIDIRLAAGQNAIGTVTTDGVNVALRRVGNQLFVKGDDKFLAALGPKAQASKGKWLVGPIASADRGLANLTDLGRFAATLTPGSGALTKEDVRSLAGQQAVSVRSSTGARLWVADVGKPYPLRLERTGAVAGFIDYGDYDAPVVVHPPSPTVDLASLNG
jgi:hypothetical protein